MNRVIARTRRLVLDELSPGRDQAFVLQLLNEPAFLLNIGDRGVRDAEAAVAYIRHQLASYRDNGFGLWRMTDPDRAVSLGICGLVRRPGLAVPDLGYAVLQEFWGRGYATEAASATVAQARDQLGLALLAAVTKPDNTASQRVLEKLGFVPKGLVSLPEQAELSSYFVLQFGAPVAP